MASRCHSHPDVLWWRSPGTPPASVVVSVDFLRSNRRSRAGGGQPIAVIAVTPPRPRRPTGSPGALRKREPATPHHAPADALRRAPSAANIVPPGTSRPATGHLGRAFPIWCGGIPGGIRTPDLLVRSQTRVVPPRPERPALPGASPRIPAPSRSVPPVPAPIVPPVVPPAAGLCSSGRRGTASSCDRPRPRGTGRVSPIRWRSPKGGGPQPSRTSSLKLAWRTSRYRQ